MKKPTHSFGSFASLISLEQSRQLSSVLVRADADRRRRQIEEQAKASRRNLQNPASFAWCAEKVAKAS